MDFNEIINKQLTNEIRVTTSNNKVINLADIEVWVGEYQPKSIENNIAHIGNGSQAIGQPNSSKPHPSSNVSRKFFRLIDGYRSYTESEFKKTNSFYEHFIDTQEMHTVEYFNIGDYISIKFPIKIKTESIREIIVYNRDDCCQDRYNDTKIGLYNDGYLITEYDNSNVITSNNEKRIVYNFSPLQNTNLASQQPSSLSTIYINDWPINYEFRESGLYTYFSKEIAFEDHLINIGKTVPVWGWPGIKDINLQSAIGLVVVQLEVEVQFIKIQTNFK